MHVYTHLYMMYNLNAILINNALWCSRFNIHKLRRRIIKKWIWCNIVLCWVEHIKCIFEMGGDSWFFFRYLFLIMNMMQRSINTLSFIHKCTLKLLFTTWNEISWNPSLSNGQYATKKRNFLIGIHQIHFSNYRSRGGWLISVNAGIPIRTGNHEG